MPGSIERRQTRDGKPCWRVRMSLGFDTRTGQRLIHNKTIHGTRKDAERYLTKLIHEHDLGTYREPSDLTVDQYLDRWLQDAVSPSLRRNTFQQYEWQLKRYVRPDLGGIFLDRLSPLQIQELYRRLREERGLSACTVRLTHRVLNTALAQAVRWNLIALNPARNVTLPRKDTGKKRALTLEQARSFLTAAQGTRFAALFKLALFAGLRPSEYLGLRWSDIDLRNSQLTIRRRLVHTVGGWDVDLPKTRRERTVPVPPEVKEALQTHQWKQSAERLAAGSEWQKLDLVFCTNQGGPVRHRNLDRQYFKPLLKAASLPLDWTLYELRHSAGSLLLATGANLRLIQELLGHSSITTTMDIYTHPEPGLLRSAVGALGEALLSSKARQSS